jgi:hypothetical protein
LAVHALKRAKGMPKIRVHQDLILDTAEIGGALIVIAVLIVQAVIIVAIAALVMGIVRKIRKYT